MKNWSILFVLFYAAAPIYSQTYTVGTQTITWTDPARSNRSVGLDFRYPGTNGAVASGQFPFVIFAHGFSMDQTPYYPYADSLAKRGYIVGLLTTETGFSPSHANFAQDLLFAYNKLISEGAGNASSVFYQKVLAKGAIGGHSMGGGSTVLSAQYENPQACSFTFAAATTNPSSITAARSMTKPYLSFAGSLDCIAPIATHQQPMYDSSASPCKFLINITGGLHCQYGNANSACSLGEGFSGCASSSLTRQQQINKTLSFLIPFLDYYLKGDCSAWTLFESRYAANTTDVLQRNCINTIPANAAISGDGFFCTGDSATLTATPAGFTYNWSNGDSTQTTAVNSVGNYHVSISNGVCAIVSSSVDITELAPPATPGVITMADTVCSGITDILISVERDTIAEFYTWTLPNGWSIVNDLNTPTIGATSGSDGGTVSVTAQNACGTSAASGTTVVVVPSNLGTPGAIVGPDTICAGVLSSYSIAPVGGATAYHWNLPTGFASANVDTNLVEVTANASGQLTVTAGNECGNSLPASINITVDTVLALGGILGPDTICPDMGAGIYYVIDPFVFGDLTYNWTIPNDWSFMGGNSNTSAPIINVASPGSIQVNVTGYCGTSNTVSLNVAFSDTPQPSITAAGSLLSATPSVAGYTYSWYFNGQPVNGAMGDTFNASQNGDYSVRVYDTKGCSGLSAPFNYIFNGIEGFPAGGYSVFPNPVTNGELVITSADKPEGDFRIYNLFSQVVSVGKLSQSHTVVDVSSLPTGNYLLVIPKGDTFFRQKLVIAD